MKTDTWHNAQSSAPTSPSERQPEVKLSEAEYLAREVTDAKAALSHSLAELKLGLAESADLRQWVKYYPWASLAAAAAAGFAAAAAVTPAQGETFKDKLARLNPDLQHNSEGDSKGAPQQSNSAKRASVTDNLINSVFDLAKVLIQTLIVTTFQRPVTGESAESNPTESDATRMAKHWPQSA
jgi:hypothetical protein